MFWGCGVGWEGTLRARSGNRLMISSVEEGKSYRLTFSAGLQRNETRYMVLYGFKPLIIPIGLLMFGSMGRRTFL